MLTNGIKKALSLCLIVALAASVGGCTAAPRRTETYTNSSGGVTILENNQESCTRSCNADFDRCGDSTAAQEPVGRGQMTGIFGGQADCRATLRSCLSRCKVL